MKKFILATASFTCLMYHIDQASAVGRYLDMPGVPCAIMSPDNTGAYPGNTGAYPGHIDPMSGYCIPDGPLVPTPIPTSPTPTPGGSNPGITATCLPGGPDRGPIGCVFGGPPRVDASGQNINECISHLIAGGAPITPAQQYAMANYYNQQCSNPMNQGYAIGEPPPSPGRY